MNEQFIGEIYRRRQEEAIQRGEANRDEVLRRHPQLAGIETEITRLSLEQGVAILQQREDEAQQLSAALERLRTERRAYLETHAIPDDYDAPVYHCPICRDRGKVGDEFCSCYRLLTASRIGLPEEEGAIRQAYFAQFDESLFSDQTEPGGKASPRATIRLARRNVESMVQAFHDPKSKNLLLTGQTGTGKTFLAGCLVHACREAGYSALFLSAPRFFSILEEADLQRRSFDPNPVRLEQALRLERWVFEADLLVIDDLGSESLDDRFKLPHLLKLMNARRRPRFLTVLTGNLTLKEFSQRYDERIFSRLRQDYLSIRLPGDDLRRLLHAKSTC